MSTILLGIDTSLLALELAKENVLLNSIDPERISFLKEDATEFMKGALLRNESWDIVIIDPPKLAPTKKVSIMTAYILLCYTIILHLGFR